MLGIICLGLTFLAVRSWGWKTLLSRAFKSIGFLGITIFALFFFFVTNGQINLTVGHYVNENEKTVFCSDGVSATLTILRTKKTLETSKILPSSYLGGKALTRFYYPNSTKVRVRAECHKDDGTFEYLVVEGYTHTSTLIDSQHVRVYYAKDVCTDQKRFTVIERSKDARLCVSGLSKEKI